jgi:hypothetical protein
MNKMRNHVSLTVGAIIAASAGVALAGGLSATKKTVSTEYIKARAANTTAATRRVNCGTVGCALGIKLNAEYAVNDTITITFTSGSLVDSELPSSFTTAGTNDGTTTRTVTFGLLSSSSSAATYRVTSLGAGTGTTKDQTASLTAANLVFDTAVAQSGVSATFSAASGSGAAFDGTIATADTATIKSTQVLIAVASQWEGAVGAPALDGVIDVAPASPATPLTRFTTTSTSTTQDVLSVTVSENSAVTFATGFTAEVSAISYTLKGDFSWAVASKASTIFVPTCGATENGSSLVSVGTSPLVAAAAGSYTWSCLRPSNVGAASTLTIKNNITGGLTGSLKAGEFTLNASVVYKSPETQSGVTTSTMATSSSAVLTGEEAGEWTINGAQIYVPYMPYGDGIDQIIYLANKGAVAGDISMQYVSAVDGSTLSTPVKIGSIAATSTKNIAGLVRDNLPDAAKVSGRLALIITVNAPAGDVDVLASYKIGTDRAFVQTRKL